MFTVGENTFFTLMYLFVFLFLFLMRSKMGESLLVISWNLTQERNVSIHVGKNRVSKKVVERNL